MESVEITVVYIAGMPHGPLQTCSRCGYILIDYRNTAGIGEWSPSWWETGSFVGVVTGNPTFTFTRTSDAEALDEESCGPQAMVA